MNGTLFSLACLIVLALLLGVVTTGRAAPAIDDGDVTRAIDADLWADERVDANAVHAVTREGIVTLTGTVETLLDRNRAERIAENIVGVRAVVNRLEVRRWSRDDEALEESVEQALSRDPAVEAERLGVEASDGRVILTGRVDSWAERDLARTVVEGVPGVRSIQDRIEIEYPEVRSDREIEADVRGRLANDVRIDDFGIEVEVEEGRVVLEGVVGSLAEKRLAWRDAWVEGVRSVVDRDLEIEWWARDEMRRKGLLEPRPDEELAEAVRDAFLYDPRVQTFRPLVHVSNGKVTLAGVVDNLAAKRAAERDARNVVGVSAVRNHLKVQPEEIPDDETLERRVEQALAEDPFVEAGAVTVEADAGTAFLEGRVKSSFERARAAIRAARVEGVVQVVNDLDARHEWEWKPDWELRSEVEDQLLWSPFVDADDVTVRVDAGVVTLRAEVATWGARTEAEENAWEAGPRDVRNQLTVEHLVHGPRAQGPLAFYYGLWGR